MRVMPNFPQRGPLFAVAVTCVLLSSPARGQNDKQVPPPAAITTADRRDGWEGVTFAEQDVRLSFPVSGLVQTITVHPGDEVKAGQELATLEDGVGLAQIELYRVRSTSMLGGEAAEKEWKLSQVEERLVREALAKGSAGQFEVDRSALKCQVAELQVAVEKQKRREAELQLAQAIAAHKQHVLASPIDGVVEEVAVSVGEGVEANKPVLRVVSTRTLRVEVHAPTARTEGLVRGARVNIQLPVGGGPQSDAPVMLQGTVTQVAQVADARSDTRLVRISLDNPRFIPAGTGAVVWFGPVPSGASSAGR